MRAEKFRSEQDSYPHYIFLTKFDTAQFKYSVIVEFRFGTKWWPNRAYFGNQNHKINLNSSLLIM